jgi:hypothetical protein
MKHAESCVSGWNDILLWHFGHKRYSGRRDPKGHAQKINIDNETMFKKA